MHRTPTDWEPALEAPVVGRASRSNQAVDRVKGQASNNSESNEVRHSTPRGPRCDLPSVRWYCDDRSFGSSAIFVVPIVCHRLSLPSCNTSRKRRCLCSVRSRRTRGNRNRLRVHCVPRDFNSQFSSQTGQILNGFLVTGFRTTRPNSAEYCDQKEGTIEIDGNLNGFHDGTSGAGTSLLQSCCVPLGPWRNQARIETRGATVRLREGTRAVLPPESASS